MIGERIADTPGQGAQLPLPYTPGTAAERSIDQLVDWISAERETLEGRLLQHGALLFRGFAVHGAADFERVARAIDPHLRNDYLGTSPRNGLTEYVFSASELPPFYPIPQHIEMSFLPNPPRRLFFACETAPERHGETPLCDFRRVYADLDPEVREAFETRGIRNIRNYDGPDAAPRRDLWKLKRWDEMFLTRDRDQVEAVAAAQGLTCEWYGEGKLRLVNEQEAIRRHPETGEPVWFNHSQVFHVAAAALEYRRIARRHKSPRAVFFAGLTGLLTAARRRLVSSQDQAMHCTFRDGGEIPDAYMEHVSETIWRHLTFTPWQPGDVIVIDNFSVSHGRMPYRGPRNILVAWTTGLTD